MAVAFLIIANIIWGAAPPIFKWSLQDIQPFTLAFLRFSLAAAILFPFAHKHLKIKKEDWLILFTASALGITFNIAYFFYGLKVASSINSPIISSAGPLFLIFGSIFFLHEKPKKRVIEGTLVSLLGVMIIILRPLFEKGGDASIVGNIFFIVSMILGVSYTLLLKEIAPKYRPMTLTFWIFTIASVCFLPFVLLESVNKGLAFVLNQQTIVGILFGAFVCSLGAYLLHAYAIKYITAEEVGVFSYVDPLVAVVIAKPLLGESITTTFLIGTVFVFLGIFVSEGRLHYHPLHLLSRKET